MPKTIRAKYHDGLIEPLEKINIDDSSEITITVSKSKKVKSAKLIDLKPFLGTWAGSQDEYDKILKAIEDSKSTAKF